MYIYKKKQTLLKLFFKNQTKFLLHSLIQKKTQKNQNKCKNLQKKKIQHAIIFPIKSSSKTSLNTSKKSVNQGQLALEILYWRTSSSIKTEKQTKET